VYNVFNYTLSTHVMANRQAF